MARATATSKRVAVRELRVAVGELGQQSWCFEGPPPRNISEPLPGNRRTDSLSQVPQLDAGCGIGAASPKPAGVTVRRNGYRCRQLGAPKVIHSV